MIKSKFVEVIKFKDTVASMSVKTSKTYSVEVSSGIVEVNDKVMVTVSFGFP